MTTKIAALALALVTLAPVTAMANKIDNRQAKQAERIEAGRQTGSITWTEGIKLRAEQRKIARRHRAGDLPVEEPPVDPEVA